jgi:hypothetical protein
MELLEKAVVDGKIKDSIMFAFEGSPAYQFMDAEKEILKSYIK